jgi:hypothetical protein
MIRPDPARGGQGASCHPQARARRLECWRRKHLVAIPDLGANLTHAELAALIVGVSKGAMSDLKTTLAVIPEEFGQAWTAELALDFKVASVDGAEPA